MDDGDVIVDDGDVIVDDEDNEDGESTLTKCDILKPTLHWKCVVKNLQQKPPTFRYTTIVNNNHSKQRAMG